jgi:hypothetical protein
MAHMVAFHEVTTPDFAQQLGFAHVFALLHRDQRAKFRQRVFHKSAMLR